MNRLDCFHTLGSAHISLNTHTEENKPSQVDGIARVGYFPSTEEVGHGSRPLFRRYLLPTDK